MINYLILHLLFIVYALNTVLGRMAAPYGWTDWRRFALLAGVLFLLGIYAAGWQVMLKKFNLGVAYANRSAVVIWGILLAWLCLGEALSWTLAAGAALVIGGIILVSTEEAHEGRILYWAEPVFRFSCFLHTGGFEKVRHE